MRHRIKNPILSRAKGPREALLRNLATSIILYEKVKTTKAKARFVRPMVEKAITIGKAKTVSARRQLHRMFMVENVVKKLQEELGPKYLARKGGYTRVTALGRRQGDAAEIVQIELV